MSLVFADWSENAIEPKLQIHNLSFEHPFRERVCRGVRE